jgi:hypothetical protein
MVDDAGTWDGDALGRGTGATLGRGTVQRPPPIQRSRAKSNNRKKRPKKQKPTRMVCVEAAWIAGSLKNFAALALLALALRVQFSHPHTGQPEAWLYRPSADTDTVPVVLPVDSAIIPSQPVRTYTSRWPYFLVSLAAAAGWLLPRPLNCCCCGGVPPLYCNIAILQYSSTRVHVCMRTYT